MNKRGQTGNFLLELIMVACIAAAFIFLFRPPVATAGTFEKEILKCKGLGGMCVSGTGCPDGKTELLFPCSSSSVCCKFDQEDAIIMEYREKDGNWGPLERDKSEAFSNKRPVGIRFWIESRASAKYCTLAIMKRGETTFGQPLALSYIAEPQEEGACPTTKPSNFFTLDFPSEDYPIQLLVRAYVSKPQTDEETQIGYINRFNATLDIKS
jgi:hypothetical protein